MEYLTRIESYRQTDYFSIVDTPRVELLGTQIHAVTEKQCCVIVLNALRQVRGGWVGTPILDHLRRCHYDPEYARTIRRANLLVADGMPLVWASKLQGTPLPERVTGSNLIFSLSEALSRERRKIFLLGGDPGMADLAGDVLARRFPGLNIVGTCCPDLGYEWNPSKIWEISNQLAAANPDVVFVGLGSPKQEYLILDFRTLLPQTWWLGVGISFSFVAGRIKRAPRWMQRCGLEWMHRLTQEPGRLARRYLIDDMPFVLKLFKDSLVKRAFTPVGSSR